MLTKILYIILALLILMVLITVHEFGHYIAGKIFKFKINEFSIGFGKAIYKKTKKNGEVFSIRILPLGGFCAFDGEDEEKPGYDAFNSRPAWQRLIVLFSGVFFNFIFGIITSAIYLMVAGYGVPLVSASRANNGILAGDKIVAVNGTTIEAYRPVTDLILKTKGQTSVTLTVIRNGKKLDIDVAKTDAAYFYVADETNIKGNLYVKVSTGGEEAEYRKVTEDEYQEFKNLVINAEVIDKDSKKVPNIEQVYYRQLENGSFEELNYNKLIKDGVLAQSNGTSMGFVYYTVAEKYGFFEALGKAWPFAFYICKVILVALGGLFTGATKLKDMGGTLTTISTIAEYSAINPMIILYLFPMLSLNLALFNILPIPALDGARMVFVLWELIFRKPVNRRVEGWIHTIGLFALLGLVLFLDVYHIFFAKAFMVLRL